MQQTMQTLAQVILLFGLTLISYFAFYKFRHYRFRVKVFAVIMGGFLTYGFTVIYPPSTTFWRLVAVTTGALLNLQGVWIMLNVFKETRQ